MFSFVQDAADNVVGVPRQPPTDTAAGGTAGPSDSGGVRPRLREVAAAATAGSLDGGSPPPTPTGQRAVSLIGISYFFNSEPVSMLFIVD